MQRVAHGTDGRPCASSSIDRLIEVQDEKLQVMEKEFDTDLEVLAAEFTEERAAITAQHAAEKSSLESLVAVVDAEEKEKVGVCVCVCVCVCPFLCLVFVVLYLRFLPLIPACRRRTAHKCCRLP